MKPPFTYFGGKTSIAERIVALLPPHEHYVEPFAGSLAVLLAKPPSPMETVNDLDGDLMNFWRVLRDDPADLERACALTPHSRAEYLASYDLPADDLERARRVWVQPDPGPRRVRCAAPAGGTTSTRAARTRRCRTTSPPTTRTAAAAARLAAVSLECRAALEMIGEYGQHPACLIYADPPYLGQRPQPAGEPRRARPEYSAEMLTDDQHRELADALARPGRGRAQRLRQPAVPGPVRGLAPHRDPGSGAWKAIERSRSCGPTARSRAGGRFST